MTPATVSEREAAELGHAEHDARQLQQCSDEGLAASAPRLQAGEVANWEPSRELSLGPGAWRPRPYPGFAFQAMGDADVRNQASVQHLFELQQALVALADGPGRFYPLPRESLHQTLISTFSGARREHHLVATGQLSGFPALLAQALGTVAPPAHRDTVRMSLVGLSMFRTAIGALGIFEDPDHYARVLALRARAYDDPRLRRIGLARTRPFIGHVTLLYLQATPGTAEQSRLLAALTAINRELRSRPLAWMMPVAELCEYAHLSAFPRHPDGLRLAL